MLVRSLADFDYVELYNNREIIINFVIFALLPFIAIIICAVITVDYYGYLKRYVSIVIYKKCHNLIKLEAKSKGISQKKLIEDIINNHYRNYHPDIQNRLRMNDNIRKRWDYKP